MATATRPRNSERQAHYQPGGDYEAWDHTTGRADNGQRDDNWQRSNTGDDNSGGFYTGNKGDIHQESLSALRNAENKALSQPEPSFYTGDRGDQDNNSDSTKFGKVKGKGSFFRKKGALITIIMILTGGGVFLGASNSLLAPAISALTTSSTQTSYTSYVLRTKFIARGMMNNAGGAVKQGWTGSLKYSKFPNYMKNRLASNGFEISGSGKDTRISWTHATSTGGTEIVEDIDAQSFLKMFNEDVEFRESFMKAKRGRVATFFDKVAEKIYKKLGISRNLFSNYKQTNDLETDVGNYRGTMEPKFDGSTTNLDGETRGLETVTKEDDDGNTYTDTEESTKPASSDTATSGSAKTDVDATKSASRMIQDFANSVGQVGAWACTAMKVGNMIAIAAVAQETYQSINYAMAQLESISKMKAGYGDDSAINSLLNFLSTSETTSTTTDFGKLGVIAVSQNNNINANDYVDVETGSPLEASGLQVMLAGTPATSKTTQNYSLERIIKTLGGAAMFGVATTSVCSGVSMTTSLISLATTIVPGGGLVKVVGSVFMKFTVSIAASVAISTFFSFLVPTLAKVFFSNAFDNALGIPAGHLLAQGISAANMQSGRAGSGQSPSSREAVLAFNHSTSEVLAMEAEQDRNRLSPFDTSNPNTFFGSIAYSLLPTITSTNITGLSSFLRSTSSSLASLMGRVSADGEGSSYLTTIASEEDCPLLAEIGVVGDLYCNPIVTTDMDTDMIELDPGDPTYVNVLMNGNLECIDQNSDNCSIKADSNLAKYITFCDNRESPFGVVDQNILGSLQKGNTITNSIPVVSEIFDIINAGIDVDNIPWANGERCSNTDKNSEFWNSEGKYYQRYIEDQRILEQMGAYEGSQNPVVAYEEAYEAEHPTDNSYIGYLSRISGLTPENTEIVLAFVNYYDFVENYDPTTRIAMEGDTSNIKNGEEVAAEIMNSVVRFDDGELVDDPIEEKVIAREHIIYADVRSRSYTIC